MRQRRHAIHEAGHAVAAVLLHRRIEYVALLPKGDTAGIVQCGRDLDWTRSMPPGRRRRMVEREVIIAFAGVVAEQLVLSTSRHRGLNSDAAMIYDLLRELHLSQGKSVSRQAIIAHGAAICEACRELLKPKAVQEAIQAVADALLVSHRLTGTQVRKLVRQRGFVGLRQTSV
jgi:hypothetical protein